METQRAGRLVVAVLALVAGPLLSSCATAQPSGGRGAGAPPTLVVLLTVDQMRADYLARFGGQFRGGFARLLRDGAQFTNAHQDHAIPETAPGHATLLSGRFPRGTGIILNGVGVDDPEAPLLDGARGAGASPRRFRGTTLGDWLRARDTTARLLSVSGKDRGAILTLGRARGEAYWYGSHGRFTTSRWYADALPDWVRDFNARSIPARRAGQAWTTLLPDSAYSERDSVSLEAAGHGFTFPHRAPPDAAGAAAHLPQTPWMDDLLLAFALEGVGQLGLGATRRTDLLSVSLSATDAIGHLYGPDSRELHDQMLRLDRALGVFLDSLFALREPGRVVVALTADHGVAPLPELSADRVTPLPLRVEPSGVLAPVRMGLRAAGVDTSAVELALGLVLLDRRALAAARLDADSLLRAVGDAARRAAGVQRADLLRDLRAADHARDAVARRWSQLLPETVTVPMVVTLAPYSIWWSDNIASHHSPHDYDTHVPLIFMGRAFRPGRHDGFVRTVDLAPTLAAALGLRVPEGLDGVVLRAALRDP